MVLPLLFGFENDDPKKFEETIATPPKRGVPTDPDSGTEWHVPLSRPVGGRYRRYLSLREGSEKTPRSAALKEGRQTYEMAVAPNKYTHASSSTILEIGRRPFKPTWIAISQKERPKGD